MLSLTATQNIFKLLQYELTLKQKVIVYLKRQKKKKQPRVVEHKFIISEANICHWKNDSNSIFSCKA